jgi:hypothetical protein
LIARAGSPGAESGVRFTYNRLICRVVGVSRPHAGEALGLGFHHGPEVVPTQGALLLKMGSDSCQVIVGQGFA